jgi:MarR family transcriptional regulator, organic hydroperoxide resistance regulator
MPNRSATKRHERSPRPQKSRVRPDRKGDVTACVDAIRRIVRALRVSAQRTQDRLGVSAAQLFVLAQLEPAHELSLSELADRTLTDRTSVAAVIERLVAGGLVIREWSTEDLRRAAVRITPAGRRLLRRAPEAPTTKLIAALESLPAETLEVLGVALTELTGAMGLADDPARLLFDDGPVGPRHALRRVNQRDARRA